MEDFLMGVVLILYSIFASAVLVYCSTSRIKPSINYVTISRAILDDLRRWCGDLLVVALRERGKHVISGALSVPADQLPGLLRRIPPRTTLVLCGRSELELCRDKIKTTLLSLGIGVVYVLDDGRNFFDALDCAAGGDPPTEMATNGGRRATGGGHSR
jgi:hypothetical protein